MTYLEYILTCSDHAKTIHKTFSTHGLMIYNLYKLRIITGKEYYAICNAFQSAVYDAIINGDHHANWKTKAYKSYWNTSSLSDLHPPTIRREAQDLPRDLDAYQNESCIMTTYEWLRVLLAVAQLVATIGAPWVVIYLDRRSRDK